MGEGRTKKGGLTAYIEKRFYQYEKIKKAVFEARKDPAACKTGGNGSGHAFVSDPTANVAMKEVMPLPSVIIEVAKNETEVIKQPEKWLKIVEQTYLYYKNGIVYDMLKSRYSGEHYQKTCRELHISSSTYYQMITEAQHYALACACQVGLVRVF
ncbi:hypothetical protein [Anaerosinus massiliensis]|uniref:hypothetical protein n=1 Tax=Massilibacillus massiliensis TaxID=1806837 RepID=UPI000DA60E7A|nr:hypothetical protein [Massilibacillus massiliensis]